MTDFEFVGPTKGVVRTNRSSPKADYDLQWERFSNHRGIVTQTILSIVPERAELCVLGCGFCWDLELSELIRRFDQITLVDLDRSAVEFGLEKQALVSSDAIKVVGGLDLSGIEAMFIQYQQQPARELLDEIIVESRKYFPAELGQFDAVASTCLLSQLLARATECVNQDDPRFTELLVAIRKRHLEIMLELLKPGGTGILVTDFVSSESLPGLFSVEATKLKTLLQNAIQEKNYLHGLNPQRVAAVFQEPEISEKISELRVSEPWRWQTADRIYACFSIAFQKRAKGL